MSEKICKNCKNWKNYTHLKSYGVCDVFKGGDFVKSENDTCEEFKRKEYNNGLCISFKSNN